MASSTEWVSFGSEEDLAPQEFPVLENPCDKPEFMTSEAYISVLEKRLKKLKGIKGKELTEISSKDLLMSLEQAKEYHLERLMTNDGCYNNHNIEAFVLEDNDQALGGSRWCCMNGYVKLFPKRPINRQELECLVSNDDDDKIDNANVDDKKP